MAMVDEQIDVTSRAFLGFTIACAKCHDHKNSIRSPTADYYALAGIFRSSEPMIGARRNRNPDPFATGVMPRGSRLRFHGQDQTDLLKAYMDKTRTSLAARDEKLHRLLRAVGGSQTKRDKEYAKVAHLPSAQESRCRGEGRPEKLAVIRERYYAALPLSAMGMRDSKPNDCAITFAARTRNSVKKYRAGSSAS